ncbi:GNAT family N-acetyltransferase [Candidatus Woesearchaeota archaeon]|nr:GNAT family N-acetyltransferase [Candidatus Woesearchaeota archaeon]MCF7901621.1 GNAT family N-acetyltransferase [Candidatus Woesearchaeota archaeon]
MIIRKYNSKDRKVVEHIHFETYFLGKSLSGFVDNKNYISEEIKYYLDKESQSCFVVEDKGNVVGYLLGCLNNKSHNDKMDFILKIFKTIIRMLWMSKKDRKFWWGMQIKVIFNALIGKSDEFKINHPKNSGHIHINLLPGCRGKGVGSKLLKEFFKYAKRNGCKRISAGTWKTRLNDTSSFWLKNGFKKYCEVKKTSFWKNLLPKEKIGLIVYVREL